MLVQSEPRSHTEHVNFEPSLIMVLLGRNKDFHVVRVPFSIDFLDRWDSELEKMNESKKGRSYLYLLYFIVSIKLELVYLILIDILSNAY